MKREDGRMWRWMTVAGVACLLSACGRDATLPPEGGRVGPPGAPSRLVNPACTPVGQTHFADTVSTAVTWTAASSPHHVTGTAVVAPGGTLTIQPGAVVCFDPGTGLRSTGGRLMAVGSSAAQIVLTAYDPAQGWSGVELQGTPPAGSQIRHARVEHVGLASTAIVSTGHLVFVDTVVVRQSGAAVSLWGRASRFGWSRVDTTTSASVAAVTLGDSARFQASVVRGAAGVGILIDGATGVRLVGSNRVEESGGVGIRAPHQTGIASSSGARVVGGLSYPIETTAPLLQDLYGSTLSNQDSLKGNARDTVLMLGGILRASLYVRSGLPWHVKGAIVVDSGGVLRGQGGSRLALDPGVFVYATSGGRVQLRGTRLNPVVLTAGDPALGWGGILLDGAPSTLSYLTNARVEHVRGNGTVAVSASGAHPVRVDSVVIRQSERAVSLLSAGSRLTRSRVDTTLSSSGAAVELGADAVLESTRIRGASSDGVWIHSASVQVVSCDIRGSVWYGILMFVAVPVHDCNLEDNFTGLVNADAATADATGNWWGDAAGPFGPNGDGFSGPVTYTPWRTTPFTLPYVP